MSNLVSTDWLADHLDEVRVVDASWYMPDEKRDPAKEFEQAHIPGAVFFDIDAIRDKASDLPHMLPGPADFARDTGALGIGDADPVVVYDGSGIFSAPRVWWMLRAMGHRNVKVLDGGLPKWRREGRAVESGPALHIARQFHAHPKPQLVRDLAAMKEIVGHHTAQVADARSAGRFTAAEAEPRPGVRGGHMPGAFNVHFRSLLTAEGTFRPHDQLRAIFERAGINLGHPIVTSCGTGVTAAILMLALEEIGMTDVALYDGSWTEWGGRSDTPVVTD